MATLPPNIHNKHKGGVMKHRALWKGVVCVVSLSVPFAASAAEMGKFKYDDFKKPSNCGACHKEIYQEWSQSLMSQSYTHEWDEVEYFKLALPHALKLEKVSGVKAGCIACHGPLAFLAGDIPPKPVKEGTRANEGVSCEICHQITGTSEAVPFNFSYNIEPGNTKQGPRGDGKSPAHGIAKSEFLTKSEFCATCHDEQSPYGAWVKETYREWKAGPYAKEGARCQDCHMYDLPGKVASSGQQRPDVAHHVFHGSHFVQKLAGAVDISIYPQAETASAGSNLDINVKLFNGKVGHYIPSGSSEERMFWLEMWVQDSQGKKTHLQVKPKGFKGEEYTIADPKIMAYFDMGEVMEVKDWKGLSRDGNLPEGARIFRKPFFNPKGEMTIMQWFTAENTQIDYRIGPRQSKFENYTWAIPADVAKGKATITATLYYSQIPSSVGEYFKLPADEYAPMKVNEATLSVEIK